MTRLGVTRVHMKNTGTGAAPSALADFELDNIVLSGSSKARAEYSFETWSTSTAQDSSGKGNHAVIEGTPQQTTSVAGNGKSIAFNGVDSALKLPSTLISGVEKGTVELLIHLNAYQPNGTYLIAKGYTPHLTEFYLWISSSGKLNFSMHLWGDNVDLVGNSLVPLGKWSHVAVTWDGLTCRLYLNGKIEAEKRTSRVPFESNEPVYVGRHSSTAHFSACAVDSIRFHDRALTTEQLVSNFASVSDAPVLTTPFTTSGGRNVYFSFSTLPGGHYVVQSSTDGKNWSEIRRFSAAGNSFTFMEERKIGPGATLYRVARLQ